ncbi:3-oxoacyl-[acyl-carrier-protein] synthase III [Renibacterium salmoninarum ATCC 33209]|uniref:3-oxoacyl-[acyl-carrier-protein] synthase III n=1 Tax=Renibacterium salmoninarum (strain ATCC 33209 / DSM 20767 / JCM 11484 / NBRC 15589 / NCIMB 2235) TaxID=288705 RepID=A9WUX6_RENSM|nr:3-oxoacyl-[acyl-carrier-protein] synthase III C-terminal domain-containing protein [Renibacterium salmoninarum]ABY24997.1 3-oxoacyl-[acyl-carrier-protein] synthase III [Renibacterium salmoninarum ATCC 33209]
MTFKEEQCRKVAARISAIGVFLPEQTRSTEETEAELRRLNPGLDLPFGLIKRLTGVERVHLRPEGWQTSDLAVAAAADALRGQDQPIELLIFASASQDLIEPATSHIVAAKLGLTCPVLDVKNACNSVLNAIQIADALIKTGQYGRVLIVSGEQPSHAVRWQLANKSQFLRAFPGYTMSDGGAAVVLERTELPASAIGSAPATVPHVLGSHFVADSKHWQVGTLGTGGSMDPHAEHSSYFDMDGRALRDAFMQLGPEPIFKGLRNMNVQTSDLDLIAIHQVATTMLTPIMEVFVLPRERCVDTVAEHGNLASVTLPLQLKTALRDGRLRESSDTTLGSLVGLVGLAGGISLGLMVVRL